MKRRQAIKTLGSTVAGIGIATAPAIASSTDYQVTYEAAYRNIGRQYVVEIDLEWSETGNEITSGSVSESTSTGLEWSFNEYTLQDEEESELQFVAYREAEFEQNVPVVGSTERLGLEVIGLTGGDSNANIQVNTISSGRTVINEL
jgi:hypothetical protein